MLLNSKQQQKSFPVSEQNLQKVNTIFAFPHKFVFLYPSLNCFSQMSDFIHPLQLLIDPQSCCENFSTAAASANLTPPSQLEDTTRRRKNGFRFVSSQVIDHNVIFIRFASLPMVCGSKLLAGRVVQSSEQRVPSAMAWTWHVKRARFLANPGNGKSSE